ncbi:hypothetical protein DPMN_159733 [Dreissena polymorpha]|uniref:RNase H type-1 domain-containing protein n=1 Tax=Dreissena polymorpha TaxID=45954 RepID=A0A9D4ENU5_DREPO|nr:hypothetical protein DPMN_159733 [Dreissena polymorpha]
MTRLSNNLNIALQWIPAHCGVSGNEEADQLAKRCKNKVTKYRGYIQRESHHHKGNHQAPARARCLSPAQQSRTSSDGSTTLRTQQTECPLVQKIQAGTLTTLSMWRRGTNC